MKSILCGIALCALVAAPPVLAQTYFVQPDGSGGGWVLGDDGDYYIHNRDDGGFTVMPMSPNEPMYFGSPNDDDSGGYTVIAPSAPLQLTPVPRDRGMSCTTYRLGDYGC